MARDEQSSATAFSALARKDTPRKRPRQKLSSESDVEGATQVEELKKKERELKRLWEDNEALERQMAEENAKKKLNWLSWQAFAIHTR
jgi:hypothetical protein